MPKVSSNTTSIYLFDPNPKLILSNCIFVIAYELSEKQEYKALVFHIAPNASIIAQNVQKSLAARALPQTPLGSIQCSSERRGGETGVGRGRDWARVWERVLDEEMQK